MNQIDLLILFANKQFNFPTIKILINKNKYIVEWRLTSENDLWTWRKGSVGKIIGAINFNYKHSIVEIH